MNKLKLLSLSLCVLLTACVAVDTTPVWETEDDDAYEEALGYCQYQIGINSYRIAPEDEHRVLKQCMRNEGYYLR